MRLCSDVFATGLAKVVETAPMKAEEAGSSVLLPLVEALNGGMPDSAMVHVLRSIVAVLKRFAQGLQQSQQRATVSCVLPLVRAGLQYRPKACLWPLAQ